MQWIRRIIVIILLCNNLFLTSPGYARSLTIFQDNTIMLTAVGDIYLGGQLQQRIISDPTFPFSGIQSVLSDTDILIGNLEVVLSLKGQRWLEKSYTLRSDPRSVYALKTAGFDGVTLANNHIMDFGPEALYETLQVLDKSGILHTGAGRNLKEARRPATITKNNRNVAILAYNNTFPLEFNAGSNRPGTAPGYPAYIINDIKQAKIRSDWVIVSFHWSEERLEWPKDYQRRLARQCIDAGASVVVGHHPHVLQGIERYQNGLIAYSLGNFSFGTWSRNVFDSIILKVELDATGFRRAFIFPLNVNNYEVGGQTRLRHGQDGIRVLRHLQKLSAPWRTRIHINPSAYGIIK